MLTASQSASATATGTTTTVVTNGTSALPNGIQLITASRRRESAIKAHRRQALSITILTVPPATPPLNTGFRYGDSWCQQQRWHHSTSIRSTIDVKAFEAGTLNLETDGGNDIQLTVSSAGTSIPLPSPLPPAFADSNLSCHSVFGMPGWET